MTHVRLYVKLFGIKFCVGAKDLPTVEAVTLLAALNLVLSHFPTVTVDSEPV